MLTKGVSGDKSWLPSDPCPEKKVNYTPLSRPIQSDHTDKAEQLPLNKLQTITDIFIMCVSPIIILRKQFWNSFTNSYPI